MNYLFQNLDFFYNMSRPKCYAFFSKNDVYNVVIHNDIKGRSVTHTYVGSNGGESSSFVITSLENSIP